MKRLIAYRYNSDTGAVLFDSFSEVIGFADKCGFDLASDIVFIIKNTVTYDLISRFLFRPRRKEQIQRMDYNNLLTLVCTGIGRFNSLLATAVAQQMNQNKEKVRQVIENDTHEDLSNIESFGVHVDDNRTEAREIKEYISNKPEVKELDEFLNECKTNYFKQDKKDGDLPMNAEDLANNNDTKGDTLKIDKRFSVDLGARETPFVYVNGQIKVGKDTDTHSMLIDELLDIDEATPQYVRDREAIGLTGDEHIGFGHIANNIAFIEDRFNSSPEEIVKALQSLNLDKIYLYKKMDNELNRLAKRKRLR